MIKYTRSDSGFDYFLGDCSEALSVGFLVSVKDGKVEAVGTVDLNVHKAGAEKHSFE